jgi:hypothetical protein
MRRAVAFLILLTALAVPSAAAGQSAGDEQYTDPFAPEEEAQQQEPQPQEQPPAPAAPEAPAAPAEPAPAPAAEAPAATDAEAAQPTDPTLPVTGLSAVLLLIVGAGLLAAGTVARRRL